MGYALLSTDTDNGLVAGVVHSYADGAALVHCAQGLLRAERAAGCLLVPAPRDTVLLALLPSGEVWVLSVLRQHTPAGTLQLPPDATVNADSLQVRTRNTRFDAEKMTFAARDMDLQGERISLSARLLSLGGQALLQSFTAVHTLAKQLTERILHKKSEHESLHEQVADLAERRAGRIRLHSDTGLRVRAEHADIRAESVLDMDAKHIKLG